MKQANHDKIRQAEVRLLASRLQRNVTRYYNNHKQTIIDDPYRRGYFTGLANARDTLRKRERYHAKRAARTHSKRA